MGWICEPSLLIYANLHLSLWMVDGQVWVICPGAGTLRVARNE